MGDAEKKEALLRRQGFGGRQRSGPRVALEDHRKSAQACQESRTLAEQETVVRFDRTGGPASLWTADINQARRWVGRGYPVEPVSGGWRAEVPKAAITFRSLSAVKASASDRTASTTASLGSWAPTECASCTAADDPLDEQGLCADCAELARLMAEEAAS